MSQSVGIWRICRGLDERHGGGLLAILKITKLDSGGLLHSQIGILALFFDAYLCSMAAASAVEMNRMRAECWVAFVIAMQG